MRNLKGQMMGIILQNPQNIKKQKFLILHFFTYLKFQQIKSQQKKLKKMKKTKVLLITGKYPLKQCVGKTFAAWRWNEK